jgi:hypothetical protein
VCYSVPYSQASKTHGFFTGCSNDDILIFQLPNSVHKLHLVPYGSPTALMKVVGDFLHADAIKKQIG